MSDNTSSNTSYLATAMGAIIVWSTSFVATKLAYTSFPPITLGMLRFALASLLLGAIVLIKGSLQRLDKGDRKTIVLSGFLGITLYFIMENTGIHLTTASNSALIIASYPAITALLEWVIYRTLVSRLQATGIALAIIGIVILAGAQSGQGGPHQFWGNLTLIGAGFAWAFYNFTTRKIVNKYSGMTIAFYQSVAGTVLFLPAVLFEAADWRMPTPMATMMLLYLAVFCSVAGYLMYNHSLRRLAATTLVSLMNLVPVLGVAFAAVILHETITLRQIIGGAIVIGGVFLSLSRPAAVQAAPQPSACTANGQDR